MRLMVIAPRFPYPLDKGDRLTIFKLLKHFGQRHRVALVAFVEPGQSLEDRRHFEDWVEAVYAVALSRPAAYWRCLRGAFSQRPLQTCYYLAPEMAALVARAVDEFRPDLVYAHTIRMGEYLLALPPAACRARDADRHDPQLRAARAVQSPAAREAPLRL